MNPNVTSHIRLFGNTNNIELIIPDIEKLERIQTMLGHNKDKIKALNKRLSDPDPHGLLFFKLPELRKQLSFQHDVRHRLEEYWNNQLKKLVL